MSKPKWVFATAIYVLLGVVAFHNMPLNPDRTTSPSRVAIAMLWPLPVLIHGLGVTFGGKAYLEGTVP